MAVTARFLADFSSFNQAVDKAEAKLTDFTSGASKVEKALARMTDQFSGRRVLQEATLMQKAVENIGGVSKLTQSELQRVGAKADEAIAKLKALGSEVPSGLQNIADQAKKIPPELNNASTAGDRLTGALGKANGLLAAFGVGLSIGAVVSFGKGLLETAGTVSDLSTATGVSTTALQKFAYVGATAGVSMDEIGRSVGTLSERLAGGDQSAMESVGKLGLSIDGLLKAGPEEAFIQIGEAVGRIEDPMQKNAVAADLFGGKLSKQLIPILGDLRTAMQDVPKDALISDADIAAVDELGDKIDQLSIKLKAYAATRILAFFKPSRGEWEKMAGVDFANAQANAGRTDIQLPAAPPALPAGFVQGYQQGADAVDDLHTSFKKFAEDSAEKAKTQLVALKDKINDLNQTTAKGLWAPKASDMSTALDGYLADLKAAESQLDKIAGINRGGVAGVWNIGVQLDTKDAQSALQRLQEQAKASLSGMLGSIVQGLPATLQQAFVGGGGLTGFGSAITSQVGEALGSKLFTAGGPMNGIGNKLAGIFGDSFGLALPGIGAALGSLVGPIMGKLFSVLKGIGGPSEKELGGRELERAFETSLGGFDAMLAKVGDAYEATSRSRDQAQRDVKALLDAEKEGPAAVQAWIDKLQVALDEAAQLRSADAQQAQAVADQIQKASSEAMQSAENDLQALIGKRDQLAKGISAEAPEAIMGVIEAQQRGQLAVLDDEIANKAEAYAKLAEETGQKMADAIVKALDGIRLSPITVPVNYDYGGINPNPLPLDPIPMASGGAFRVTKPTLFLAGEAGAEDAAFSGANKRFGAAGATTDVSGLALEVSALRRELVGGMFATQMALAIQTAAAKQGAGRR